MSPLDKKVEVMTALDGLAAAAAAAASAVRSAPKFAGVFRSALCGRAKARRPTPAGPWPRRRSRRREGQQGLRLDRTRQVHKSPSVTALERIRPVAGPTTTICVRDK